MTRTNSESYVYKAWSYDRCFKFNKDRQRLLKDSEHLAFQRLKLTTTLNTGIDFLFSIFLIKLITFTITKRNCKKYFIFCSLSSDYE